MKQVIEENIYGRSPHKAYTVNYNVNGDECESIITESASLTEFIDAVGEGISQVEIQIIEDAIDEYRDEKTTEEEKLKCEKKNLIRLISEFDNSENVNSFTVNGMKYWLDKETRAGLILRFDAEKENGKTDTSLWVGNVCIPLSIDNAIKMLYALEVYASTCYDKTAEHKSDVDKMTTLTEVRSYTYTNNYPTKLIFK